MDRDKQTTAQFSFFSLIPVVIVAMWFAWLIGVLLSGSGVNLFGEKRFDFELVGQFGDSFGSLSGLMASLAASGAWYAVFLQRKALDQQATDRLADDKLRRQLAFEQNFFQLLGHLSSIVRETDIVSYRATPDEQTYSGKDAFRRLLLVLRNNFRSSSLVGAHFDAQNWDISYRQYQDDLGHYFRSLYHICNYIKSNNDIDRNFYMKYVFAQLSNSEMILVGINCAVGRGRNNFHPIINEFRCLTNIGFDARHPHEERILRAHFNEDALPLNQGDDPLLSEII